MSHYQPSGAGSRAPPPVRAPSPNTQSRSRAPASARTQAAPRLPPKEPSSNHHHHNNNNNNNHNYLGIPASTSSFGNLSSYARDDTGSRSQSQSHTDAELARAVRDSVQIRSPSPRLAPASASAQAGRSSRSMSPAGMVGETAALPSVNFAAASTSTSQPGHSHTAFNSDMAGTSHAHQSTVPRSVLGLAANPFEEEPRAPGQPTRTRGAEGGGVVQPSRQNFSRALTATSASQTPLLAPPSPDRATGASAANGSTKTRVRRSLSNDSYGLDTPAQREITAGQKKAAADKKGGKHADIIDRWDPTGLGDAMWHHAGPYDAAAPSRNVGNSRSPMNVFTPPLPDAPKKSAPPPVPVVDIEKPTPAVPAAARPAPANRRVSGGGLTGQYSTSVPAAGGYFPDVDKPQDEVSFARQEREREREQKRRALKAAWGIDEPEPWEDFGISPGEGAIDITNSGLSPDATAGPIRSPGLRLGQPRTPPIKEGVPLDTETTADLPGSAAAGRPAGGVKRTKSLMQKLKTMVRTRSGSVESDHNAPPVPALAPGSLGRNTRTRASLGGADTNQASLGGMGQRSQSMTAADFGQERYDYRRGLSPGRGVGGSGGGGGGGLPSRMVQEEEIVEGDDQFADADEDVFGQRGARRENKSGIPFRSSSPSKAVMPSSPSYEFPLESPNERDVGTGTRADENPFASPPQKSRTVQLVGGGDAQFDDAIEEITDRPGLNRSETDSDFVFVDSPNSKARKSKTSAADGGSGIPPVPALPPSISYSGGLSASSRSGTSRPNGTGPGSGSGTADAFRALDRVKNLPPPPVGQVMPDFGDLVAARPPSNRRSSNLVVTHAEVEGAGATGVRRKGSVVKKIKDRIR